MKFVVKREKWRCGGNGSDENKVGKGSTYLRNEQGFMCCLGHCALQLGVKSKEMIGVDMPDGVGLKGDNPVKVIPVLTKKSKTSSFPTDTTLSTKAATINDDEKLTTKQRERKLKGLFSKYKHQIVFTGKVIVPRKGRKVA